MPKLNGLPSETRVTTTQNVVTPILGGIANHTSPPHHNNNNKHKTIPGNRTIPGNKKKGETPKKASPPKKKSGSDLLSHTVPHAVP
ncbi:MAG: hypothetical protein ACTHXA_15345, partial [Gulosibacter sp.]|uniref:hypothetical protein n=1 Tax=Gulosibacter sp. TaxID=2817531 RepID=UPI003F91E42F